MLKFKNRKFMMLAAAAAIALPVGLVSAATTNLHATANFRAAITLTPTAMNFSAVDFSAAPGAGDTISLGSNGSIAYAGVFSAGTGAAPSAGNVNVTTGSSGLVVEVRCNATGTLANAAGTSLIPLNSVQVAATTGVAFGSAAACAGSGAAAAATTLTLDGTDDFKFGARIAGPATGTFGGAYSTSNTNGVPVVVNVTYQ